MEKSEEQQWLLVLRKKHADRVLDFQNSLLLKFSKILLHIKERQKGSCILRNRFISFK